MRTRPWSELAITATGGACYATGAFLPFVAPLLIEDFITRFGLRVQIAGAIATGQFFLLSLTGLVFASLLDRFDARKAAVLGVALSAGGCLCAVLAQGVIAVSSALIVAYVGQGIAGVAAYGVALSAKRPARSFAIMTSAGYLYGAIWLYLIPVMEVRHIGARPTLLACAIATVALCAVALGGVGFVPPRPAVEPQETRSDPRFRGWLSVALLGSEMVVFTGGAAIWTFSVEIGTRQGLGLEAVGVLLSAAAIATFIGPILASFLRARYGLVAITTAFLSLYVAACFVSGSDMGTVAFALAFLALGIVQGLLIPLLFEMGLCVDPTGRTSGSTYSFLYFGYALGPLIGGLAFGVSSYTLGWASSAAAFVGSLGIGWVLRRALVTDKPPAT